MLIADSYLYLVVALLGIYMQVEQLIQLGCLLLEIGPLMQKSGLRASFSVCGPL
jgi:hypothetical protein